MPSQKKPFTLYLDADIEDWLLTQLTGRRSSLINAVMRAHLIQQGFLKSEDAVPLLLPLPVPAPVPVPVPVPSPNDALASIPESDATQAVVCIPVAEQPKNEAESLQVKDILRRVCELETTSKMMDGSHRALDRRVESLEDFRDDPQCECSENHDSEGIDRLTGAVDRCCVQIQKLKDDYGEQSKRLQVLETFHEEGFLEFLVALKKRWDDNPEQ